MRARAIGWRVLAILLVLLGLSAASFRDVPLADDWYFASVDPHPVLCSRHAEADELLAGETPGQGDGPEHFAARAEAAVLGVAQCEDRWLVARLELQSRHLLPASTGPPRA